MVNDDCYKCFLNGVIFCQEEVHIKSVSRHLNIMSLSELVLDYYKRFGGCNMKHQNISIQDYR